jgi:hypothetical protein
MNIRKYERNELHELIRTSQEGSVILEGRQECCRRMGAAGLAAHFVRMVGADATRTPEARLEGARQPEPVRPTGWGDPLNNNPVGINGLPTNGRT